MRKFNRADCPQALIERGEKWTTDLAERGRWTDWPQYGKRKLNHLLLEQGLRSQTQEHCSYCDMTPICPPGTETIDHFRPKSGTKGRLELAFEWHNLYYCCNNCQRHKGEQFEEALLKPDDPDYHFETYFQWNFATGELQPNEVASVEIQNRAVCTINVFKLYEKHSNLRLKERRDYESSESPCLDDFSYRDFLEWVVPQAS